MAVALVSAGAILSGGVALADDGADGFETADDAGRSARIEVHPGYAEATMRFRHKNPTARLAEAIDSGPGPFAVVGLRTLMGGRSWEASLWPREQAWQRFLGPEEARFEFGAYFGMMPNGGRFPMLVLSAIPAGAEVTAELRILLPTRYVEGRHRVDVQMLRWSDEDRVSVGRGGAGTLFADEEPLLQALARDGSLRAAELSLKPHQAGAVEGELARIDLGRGRVLTRLRFSLRPELSRVAPAIHAVVVVDGSRSLGPQGFESQRKLLSDYLAALPADARAEVVTFDRDARAVHGRFVAAATAAAEVAELAYPNRHGSNLDRGLALAASRLATAPPQATRRLVVLTDGRVPSAFTTDRLAASMPEALAHFVVRGESRRSWVEPVEASGGLLWTHVDDPERLVRPKRLMQARHVVGGHETDLGSLEEGEGVDLLTFDLPGGHGADLHGRLWAAELSHHLEPSPASARRWAALAIFDDRVQLDDEEVRALAVLGGAVTEHTSFVTASSGRRLAPRIGFGTTGGSGVGRDGVGHRGVGGHVAPNPAAAEEALRGLLRSLTDGCGAREAHGRARLETTFSELVAIAVEGLSEDQRACLEEAVWQADLPKPVEVFMRHRWDLLF
ncbi:MAG: VWA domain-containing protein [Polyangiaceae bacterium]